MLSLYNQSLALLTDLYEITMAYGYWKRQMADYEAVFNLFFRKQPFNGGYAIAAGLESVIHYVQNWRFDTSDIDFLATLKDSRNEPLFEEGFLKHLSLLRFSCDIDAVCEGDVVFPYEPLIRVQGPLLQAQLLESPLLTLTNFPTLIATKASRICLAAGSDPVLEFGLRRAQGIDGAITATRATFIGGCYATSNTLAGKLFNIPIRGTHAHSWVMAFGSELESFQAYAEVMPNNSVFLVDTYDTLEGVRHAVQVGKWLKEQGRPFLGIRLDSGDIAYLSAKSREMLDEAGLQEAQIYASNELDEVLISDLKSQGAKVSIWGVGTHMVTGRPQAALDGVYKITALRKPGEKEWDYKLKISERMAKISDPGILQIRRFETKEHGYIADAIYDIHHDISKGCKIVDPHDPTRKKTLGSELNFRDVLVPIFRKGKLIYKIPTLYEAQKLCKQELAKFHPGIKRFYNPHNYPVGMEENLFNLKLKLIQKAKDENINHRRHSK